MLKIWVVEQLLASKVGFNYMELVRSDHLPQTHKSKCCIKYRETLTIPTLSNLKPHILH
jgi:hypothetical protein